MRQRPRGGSWTCIITRCHPPTHETRDRTPPQNKSPDHHEEIGSRVCGRTGSFHKPTGARNRQYQRVGSSLSRKERCAACGLDGHHGLMHDEPAAAAGCEASANPCACAHAVVPKTVGFPLGAEYAESSRSAAGSFKFALCYKLVPTVAVACRGHLAYERELTLTCIGFILASA